MTLDEQIVGVVARAVTAALRAERQEQTVDDTGQLVVSAAEAGRRLDVHQDTIRQMVQLGDLDAVYGLGRGMKVTVASLHRWVEEHTTNAIKPLRRVS